MSSVKFYTLYPMRTATVADTSVNIHTYYPARNALDYNRNTQCRGSSSSSIQIDIDFDTMQSIDGIIIDIRNYDNNGVVGVDRYCNKNSFISGGPALPTTHPLLANGFGTTYNCSSFRLTFNSGYPNVHIGMVGLCHIYELPNRHQYPRTGGRQALVDKVQMSGGRQHITVGSQNGVTYLTHKYFLSTLQQKDDLESVFKESAELGLPFVMVDGDNDPLMLRWDRDIMWREIDFNIFEATCRFVEVPYAESGESY